MTSSSLQPVETELPPPQPRLAKVGGAATVTVTAVAATSAPVATAAPVAAAAPPVAVQADAFVINLCSSTTPMALSQPQSPQLKRFTFFVSRRLEDGRERFRLHMGYFATLPEAESLLPLVREIYPGAWAGDAPGKRLRARAAAALEAPAAPEVVPQAVPTAVALPVVALQVVDTHVAAPPAVALQAVEAQVVVAPVGALQAEEMQVLAPQAVPTALALQTVHTGLSAPSEVAPLALELQAVAPPVPARDAAVPFASRSNVREVLASLDETGFTQKMPALPAAPAPGADTTLNEPQVLELLEERRQVIPSSLGADADSAGACNAPVAFSVQLQWSVQAIDLNAVPPLAIFSAYTLYTVEGSREGRRWYGLRLGFFSDALAAKQVAQYVRSEFASVAVVPVSAKERSGATGAPANSDAAAEAANAASRPRSPEQSAEFQLFEDGREKSTSGAPTLQAVGAAKAAGATRRGGAPAGDDAIPGNGTATPRSAGATARSGGTKPGRPRGKRVYVRDKRPEHTLEETLEILGADQLKLDNGRRERVTETGGRRAAPKAQKNSPFTRLLQRLSERR